MASNGWARWTPVNAAAIGLHLVGEPSASGWRTEDAMFAQRGVGAAERGEDGASPGRRSWPPPRTARVLGKKIELASSPNQEEGRGADDVPVDVEQAQKQLSVVQWSIPVLTGVLEVLNALHGEQQRPREQVRGVVQKVMSLPGQLRAAAGEEATSRSAMVRFGRASRTGRNRPMGPRGRDQAAGGWRNEPSGGR